MLTDRDIAWMKENRSQITNNRTEPFELTILVAGSTDPFTGDTTYTEDTQVIDGTWKSLISQSGGEGEIEYVNGVKVETDDVIVNFDISVDIENVSQIKRLLTGDEYVIKAKDMLGIGTPNRHFVLLELVK